MTALFGPEDRGARSEPEPEVRRQPREASACPPPPDRRLGEKYCCYYDIVRGIRYYRLLLS